MSTLCNAEHEPLTASGANSRASVFNAFWLPVTEKWLPFCLSHYHGIRDRKQSLDGGHLFHQISEPKVAAGTGRRPLWCSSWELSLKKSCCLHAPWSYVPAHCLEEWISSFRQDLGLLWCESLNRVPGEEGGTGMKLAQEHPSQPGGSPGSNVLLYIKHKTRKWHWIVQMLCFLYIS